MKKDIQIMYLKSKTEYMSPYYFLFSIHS